jgi:tRNA-2-methylthio-N6-dimethylallyladenosine synthase
LSLMKEVGYDMAYMFKYSERPKTLAERKFEDNVPEETKGRRLTEIIDLQMQSASSRTKLHVGKIQKVLVEGVSKKSKEHHFGRNSENVVVVFPKGNSRIGEYVQIRNLDATSVTLLGEITH